MELLLLGSKSIQVNDRQTLEKIGDSLKIFVSGKEIFLAPPTEEDIRKVFETRVKNIANAARLEENNESTRSTT